MRVSSSKNIYTWDDYRSWEDHQRWEVVGGEAHAMRRALVLLALCGCGPIPAAPTPASVRGWDGSESAASCST